MRTAKSVAEALRAVQVECGCIEARERAAVQGGHPGLAAVPAPPKQRTLRDLTAAGGPLQGRMV